MGKALSLLRYQFKVLSSYFRKGTRWDLQLFKEFVTYSFYYFSNFWYYLFLMSFESFSINNKKLKMADKKLEKAYQENNQFWISLKQGYRIKHEKIQNLTYGETSYLAIKTSLETVGINENDIFYDLGCGIGKTVFFANLVYGCKSVGVDIIPDFISTANNIVREMNLKDINFIDKSIFDFNYNDGTVFYITPTCFDAENMRKLYKKFETLPKNSRLIVLTKDIKLPNLQLITRKKLFYSWGMAETFYYKIV